MRKNVSSMTSLVIRPLMAEEMVILNPATSTSILMSSSRDLTACSRTTTVHTREHTSMHTRGHTLSDLEATPSLRTSSMTLVMDWTWIVIHLVMISLVVPSILTTLATCINSTCAATLTCTTTCTMDTCIRHSIHLEARQMVSILKFNFLAYKSLQALISLLNVHMKRTLYTRYLNG